MKLIQEKDTSEQLECEKVILERQVCVCLCMSVCACVCVCLLVRLRIYVHLPTCPSAHVCICLRMCASAYLSACACVCVCVQLVSVCLCVVCSGEFVMLLLCCFSCVICACRWRSFRITELRWIPSLELRLKLKNWRTFSGQKRGDTHTLQYFTHLMCYCEGLSHQRCFFSGVKWF